MTPKLVRKQPFLSRHCLGTLKGMRITGLDKEQVGEDIRRVFEQQEQRYGSVLHNHQILARRPSLFRGFRAMWDGIEESGLLPARLLDLVNVRVAGICFVP